MAVKFSGRGCDAMGQLEAEVCPSWKQVLERIYGISDLLLRQFDMKCAAKKKNHRDYSLTEVLTLHVNGTYISIYNSLWV